MAGICVDAKEIERTSNQLGTDIVEFYRKEAAPFLSGKVVPIQSVPRMYVCIDGTGVPVVKAETEGRKGKGKDGHAKTREVKLGCVFTQTGLDKKGYPVRDELSASYVGAIETAEVFGSRIYAEALSRGLEKAQRIVVIGDGAPWIWNIADEQFYGAIQIIDLYHAREHYWSVARAVFGCDKETIKTWTDERRSELNQGKVEQVIEAIKDLLSFTEDEKELLEKEIGYFEKNKERMRYNEFRRQGESFA